jgi:hypothetical protein
MSNEKIDRLKAFLVAEGLVENGFYVEGDGGNSVRITVTIPLDYEEELPEELKPFAWDSYELERAMDKGNTEKKTWNGANFEMALRSYVGELMDQHPEIAAIHELLQDKDAVFPKLEEYQALRKRVFDELCAQPQIAEWDKKLNEYYV